MSTKNTRIFARLPQVLLPWYRANKRDLPWRADKDPYHVWLSEIMLQQTRVEAVRGYYARFLQAAPTVQALANLPQEQLFKLWEGLGYYNRARNLQKAAKIVAERGEFPNTYNEILALPGVGPYTAGAVASICFEQPVAAVDGNVLRIIARMTQLADPIDADATKTQMAAQLQRVYPQGACGDFTQALMELGATVCTPKSPKCEVCPAKDFCRAFKHKTVEKFPVKLPKREKRAEQKTVFYLLCGDRTAIERRQGNGLLAGLWQLPNLAGALTAQQALEQVAAWGAEPLELRQELHRTHIFTHIKWDMVCYVIACKTPCSRFVWGSREQIQKDYALPTAFRMFVEERTD